MKDEEQQQQQKVPYTDTSWGTPQIQDYDTVKLRIDPASLLEDLKHQMLGMQYHEKEGKYVPVQGLKPLMTLEGANQLIRLLQHYVCIPMLMSKMSEEQVVNRTKEAAKVVRDFIYWHWLDYNIQPSEWEQITTSCRDLVFGFLLRAKDGEERKLLSEQHSVQETIRHDEEENRQKKRFGIF